MGVRFIESTLFRFIWKYSRREQFVLLLVTACLFPFLFLTLELPKRIINDAIGAPGPQKVFLGIEMSQVAFLAILCVGFLLTVLLHGLLKMRINTMKGVLAERMLRRLRFGLFEQMLRFPKPYFRRTSQGEMVTMITTETEPMGGLMGDALAQPVLQAGQMLTILFFLFLQSFWFGLAAIAMIPVQAWLIPKLQRQINLLNKDRIREVRDLAGIIGESASGASDLRLHGGWRYRLALVSDRLGRIFCLRFKIYQKKFFMKFINNFLTQLTPFFFFAIGGYLVIKGAVSLGALVAALAAYKDLSSPWKELLTYYNQMQDMSLRWDSVREKFAPDQGLDARFMLSPEDAIPCLDGALTLEDVTVADEDGIPVLQNISGSFEAGSSIAITAKSEIDRLAMADVLTREVSPRSGHLRLGDNNLADLPQAVIAARIGHVSSKPNLFRGRFRDNVLMAMMAEPDARANTITSPAEMEAAEAGNSTDPMDAEWLNFATAGFKSEAALQAWWLKIIEATGSDTAFFARALDQALGDTDSEALVRGLVAARPIIWQAVRDAGLARHLHRFDVNSYNPALSIVENLFFATPRQQVSQSEWVQQVELLAVLRDLGLEADLLELSREIVLLLRGIFGSDGTSHPLFQKLGFDGNVFQQADLIITGAKKDLVDTLEPSEKALLISISARISANQIGADFPEEIAAKVLGLRLTQRDNPLKILPPPYVPLDPRQVAPGLTLMENALFGKISDGAGAREQDLRGIVSDILTRADLKPDVMNLIFDMEVSLGGSNLPAVFAESLALARAAIKRPDVLVLDSPLASFDPAARQGLPKNLRKLLPDTTMIFLSDRFDDPLAFDAQLEIRQGRIVSAMDAVSEEDNAMTAELVRKLRALESTDLFGGLDRKQLRMLAFGAKFFNAAAGEVIFNKHDDPSDGAYMILQGTADLYDPDAEASETLVATVGAGTLVGELGLIRKVPRALSMRARDDLETLRLGADEFLSVVEHDAATAFKLLQVVASYSR